MAEFILQEDPFVAEKAYLTPISTVGSPKTAKTSDPLEAWRKEIDAYFHAVKKFDGNDPAQVFLSLASFSARVSEMMNLISRSETRRLQSFKKNELEPFLDECERQFRFFSRAVSVREQEIKLSGGQV